MLRVELLVDGRNELAMRARSGACASSASTGRQPRSDGTALRRGSHGFALCARPATRSMRNGFHFPRPRQRARGAIAAPEAYIRRTRLNLDILYVASMARPFRGRGRQERDAGGLFAVHGLGVHGLPENRFKG